MNQDQEYFIRELTRKLNEQINSVRRELDNLKKFGLLRSRAKNRKKYYYVNKKFIFLEELRSIIIKGLSSNDTVTQDIKAMGEVKLLALAGIFINKPTEGVDMLIVGNIDRERLTKYINNDLKTERPVKFAIMDEEDYKFRLSCNDQFVSDIINDRGNQIVINQL